MYVYIKGILKETFHDRVTIETAGIGYELKITLLTYHNLPALEEEVMFYTHHYVREDKEELYGFSTRGEKKLFEILITIPNIGPGKAMNILSQIQPEHFVAALQNKDVSIISSIKGIGRRTAERLIVELSDKVIDIIPVKETGVPPNNLEDALAGLVSLGFKDTTARGLLNSITDEISKDDNVADIIKKALKKHG